MKINIRILKALLIAATLFGVTPFTAVQAAATSSAAPPLVSASWLRDRIGQNGLVILEVYDKDRQIFKYDDGHIPGAIFTGFLDDGWETVNTGYPFMLPTAAHLAQVIGGYGINNKTRVILVPAGRKRGDFKATARIYWTFRYLGDNNVSILNGGDRAWFAHAAYPVATQTSTPKATSFVPHVAPGYLARTKTVQGALRQEHVQLVDARPPAQFEGKKKAPVDAKAGTLQGAVNLPYDRFLTSDGEGVLSKSQIAQVIARAGITPKANAIIFCNTGHLASSDWFALREVEGIPGERLYTGSMSTWTRKGLPVVDGR